MKKAFIILIFSLTACGILDSNNSQDSYFPLQVGNKWYYSSDKSENINNATLWEITGTKNINGNEYYVIEKSHSLSIKDTSYYRWDGSKLIQLFIIKSKNNYCLESTFADFTITKNETFYCYAMTLNNEDFYSKVSLISKSDKKITFSYDIMEFKDEEHSITFEKGKGIVEFYSIGWGNHTYLIHYELK